MGRTSSVHQEYYRLPSSTIEVAKIGKLLLAMEKGINKYAGKKLEDIELSDIEED